MLRNKSGKIDISIVLTGIIGLAGLCFLLYVFTHMPESGIETPDIGDPLLYIGALIVLVVLIAYILKRR